MEIRMKWIDGIGYPQMTEPTETEDEVMVSTGKFGRMWMRFMKENDTDRYYHFLRLGQLEEVTKRVDEEANDRLDDIMEAQLKKVVYVNSNSTMERWTKHEQIHRLAEEIVLKEIVLCKR